VRRAKAAFSSGRDTRPAISIQPEAIGAVVTMIGFGSPTDYCTAQTDRPLTGKEAWIGRASKIIPDYPQEKSES